MSGVLPSCPSPATIYWSLGRLNFALMVMGVGGGVDGGEVVAAELAVEGADFALVHDRHRALDVDA